MMAKGRKYDPAYGWCKMKGFYGYEDPSCILGGEQFFSRAVRISRRIGASTLNMQRL